MIDAFMNWRMYSNEDNLVGDDRIYNKFLDIYILNPRTHIRNWKAVFTDYEVHVKTNHPEFSIKESSVRRRYSHFVWLKNRLGMDDVMMVTAPSLPGKKYFGRFKDPFLKKRQCGLQSFMNQVVEINAFLSDPALHLFLQTSLSISQMNKLLHKGMHLSNIRDQIIKIRNSQPTLDTADGAESTGGSQATPTIPKRTASLGDVTPPKEVPKVYGRGWSQFIGDEYCTWEVTRDKEDGNYRSMSSTARVSPGGQIRLPEDNQVSPAPQRPRSHSWHGKTSDFVDLLLGSYDIITSVPTPVDNDKSFTLSYSSSGKSPAVFESSDDGIEVDMASRLSEYAIIQSPDKYGFPLSEKKKSYDNKRSMTDGFHHSYSYDEQR